MARRSSRSRPGPLTTVTVTPRSANVRARASQALAAAGVDAFGNLFPVAATWSLTPPSMGKLSTRAGSSTSFTAGRMLGRVTVSATVATPTGTLSSAAALRVAPGRLRIAGITYRVRKDRMLVSVSARDAAGRPVSRARIAALVRRDGRRYVSARAETGAAGRIVYSIPLPRRGGCLSTTIRRVSAAGFAWDGRTPRNRRCRPRSR